MHPEKESAIKATSRFLTCPVYRIAAGKGREADGKQAKLPPSGR
jgi:hypothetical protein